MASSSRIKRVMSPMPSCRHFFLELAPKVCVSRLPYVFYRKFHHELSVKVYFRDRHGNAVKLMLDRGERTAYIIDGYVQLVNFYRLGGGGWIKAFYAGNNVFYISVKDIDLKRVPYPHPPTKISLEVQPINISSSGSHSDRDFSRQSHSNEIEDFEVENEVVDVDSININPAQVQHPTSDDACVAESSEVCGKVAQSEIVQQLNPNPNIKDICFGPFSNLWGIESNPVWMNRALLDRNNVSGEDASILN